jgi:hypothetical protein
MRIDLLEGAIIALSVLLVGWMLSGVAFHGLAGC